MTQTNPTIDRLNSIIKDVETVRCITRASELQRAACGRLKDLLAECREQKVAAVSAGDEDFANLVLGFECVARYLRAEIEMWLLLKEEKPDEAWDKLVSAQNSAIAAVRAHRGFAHLEKIGERLLTIEKILFPPQTFVSTGLVVRNQICSICGTEYGECDHLAGKPYWGRFCAIITRGIEANHLALVKEPDDKGCRVTHIGVPGGSENKMTLRIEKDDQLTGQAVEGQPGLIVRARLLRASVDEAE